MTKIQSQGNDKKKWLTEVFNLGFRRGANDRAAIGLAPGPDNHPPTETPPADIECCSSKEQQTWNQGYDMGYRAGASDAELASTDIPGAHGMIRGFTQECLQMIGFFNE
jgi:hypothetical protein